MFIGWLRRVYGEYHAEGEAEAVTKGLEAGYADGYATDSARSHALGYIDEYVYAIRNMSKCGVDIDVICAVCDITAEEANSIIKKDESRDTIQEHLKPAPAVGF